MDCGPHFKCGELIHYLLFNIENIKYIHYFGEKHGKSPCDAHFSLLTRIYNDITNIKTIDSIDSLITSYNEHFNNFNKNNKKNMKSNSLN